MFPRRRLDSLLGFLLVGSFAIGLVSAAEPAKPYAELRTWTSANGKFHVRATLVDVRDGSVVLKKESGDKITVSRRSLSRADSDYLDRQTAGVLSAVKSKDGPAAEDSQRAWRRWAVVCSRDVQKSHFGDLLTVELGKFPELELVERDELAKLAGELELSQLVGANSAGGRLLLGRMVRADALALIERIGVKATSPLRLVIAECRQGARLHQQEFATDAEEAAAAQIAMVIRNSRRRFPRGITQLLGVSDFISHNLTHDYDAMQTRYAGLLRAALSLEEGVAVLEIEEARSIARELTGGDVGDRRLPLIVEGAFQMEAANPSSPAVTLEIELAGGSSTQSIRSPRLALNAAPAWIAGELAQKVLRRAGTEIPLRAAEQAALLSSRADEFTALGACDQAVKLREAALLVQPEAVALRLTLVSECLALVSNGPQFEVPKDQRGTFPGSPAIKKNYGAKVDWYLEAMEHVEFLIRNRQVDRDQALDLCCKLRPESSVNYLPTRFVIRLGSSYYRIGQEELARAQKPARKFFLEVVPKILELPPAANKVKNERDDAAFLQAWQGVFLISVLQRTDVSYPVARDLTDLARAYTQILPDGLPVPQIELPSMPDEFGPRAAMPDDFEAFYRTLASSTHKVSSIRGRYMLLELEARSAGLTRQRAESIHKEIGKLEEEYRGLLSHSRAKASSLGEWSRPSRLCRAIEAFLQRTERPAVGQTPVAVLPRAWQREPEEPQLNTGAVRFEPVALSIKRLDGTVKRFDPTFTDGRILGAGGMDVVSCLPGIDLYYCNGGLCLMRKAGLLEELILDEEHYWFRRVVWDGRQFWAARWDGSVWIVSTGGKVLAKLVAEQGLPPSADGPLLHPIAAGRVVALGSFGDPPRAWAAELTWSENKAATAKVFFQAKRALPPGRSQSESKEAMDIGFRVGSAHAYQPKGEKGRPLLLVARLQAHPLAIDLKTLAVSVFNCEFKVDGSVHEQIYFSHDGVLFLGWPPNLWLMPPPPGRWPDGKFLREIPLVNLAPRNSDYSRGRLPSEMDCINTEDYFGRPLLLGPGDGYLYTFGSFWHRIKLATLTAQRLTTTRMPGRYDDCHNFGVSAHYGLVAWLQGTLFQIRVDEAAIPHGDTADK